MQWRVPSSVSRVSKHITIYDIFQNGGQANHLQALAPNNNDKTTEKALSFTFNPFTLILIFLLAPYFHML